MTDEILYVEGVDGTVAVDLATGDTEDADGTELPLPGSTESLPAHLRRARRHLRRHRGIHGSHGPVPPGATDPSVVKLLGRGG